MITTKKLGGVLYFERDDGAKAKYDFKKQKLIKYNKDGNISKSKYPQTFFSNYHYEQILDGFKDKKYADFLRLIQYIEPRCTNIGTILRKVPNYSNLEQYISLGIKCVPEGYYWGRDNYLKSRVPKKPLSFYSKQIRKFIIKEKIMVDREFEKFFEKYNQNNMIEKLITFLQNYFEQDRYDFYIENFIKESYSRSKNMSHFLDMVETYNYEYKALIKYLENLYLYENFDLNNNSLNTLFDYVTMSDTLSQNGKFEKYPRNLKTTHDIVVRNYNNFKKEYSEEIFKKTYDKNLEYKNNDYMITCPKKPKELQDEGVNLNHCVASYIDNVIDKKTKILFLRKEKGKSLVTIELKNKNIVQARGKFNRFITDNEKKFLEKYANNKKLVVNL